MTSNTITAREQRLRRALRREGLGLVKYREDSRWFFQYGPYALVDDNRVLAAWGLDLHTLEQEIAS